MPIVVSIKELASCAPALPGRKKARKIASVVVIKTDERRIREKLGVVDKLNWKCMGKECVGFVFREYYAQSKNAPEKPVQENSSLNNYNSIL